MELHRLLQEIKVKEILGDASVEVSGLSYDSRTVKPGFLFAAIRGTQQDGHQFLESAIQNGASALLVESPQKNKLENHAPTQIVVPNVRHALGFVANAFYHHPTDRLLVIGVTGTNGKTTTTYLCESLFRVAGQKTGVIGTIENKIGDKSYPCKNTTPESVDLFELFHNMEQEGVTEVAMEVSSHALEQGRVNGILFDVVVFTNLTQDHLDYHHDMESYFQAKSKLFTEISFKKKPIAVINIDDEYGRRLVEKAMMPVITYGMYGLSTADVSADAIQMSWSGISFQLKTKLGTVPIQMKLSGKFNVYNALAATGVGIAKGLSLTIVQQWLQSAEPVRGRFELVHRGQDFGVVVDYAHSPDGLVNLLQSARQLTQGKLIVVFGCGGDRDRTKRPLMGKVVETYGDVAVVTSDNPRSEEPRSIITEIETGMTRAHHVEVDRKQAIGYAISLAQSGDCVVIAGKGHETIQKFKDKTIHFDDREVAAEFLEKRGATQTF